MTNKQKFISAFKDTILKYENPQAWAEKHCRSGMVLYGSTDSCPICALIGNPLWGSCVPCPMANRERGGGCIDFKSYPGDHESRFPARIKALRKMIKVMEKWPESRFTVKGWKFSGKELPRSW